jgi:hypothetical protein
MTIHTPKAFRRGRNQVIRPINTYLNLRNAKLKDDAEKERARWAKDIKANHLVGANGMPLPNPIKGYMQLHPTRGYKFERF